MMGKLSVRRQSGPKTYDRSTSYSRHSGRCLSLCTSTAWYQSAGVAPPPATGSNRCTTDPRSAEVASGPLFNSAAFGMVDAIFDPVFRCFNSLDQAASQPVFENLSRALARSNAIALRLSVIDAVKSDYALRFRKHLRDDAALLAS